MTFNLEHYKKGSVINFSYPCGEEKTTCYPYRGKFPAGVYKFDVFGAEGGRAFNEKGGFGGHSTGKIALYEPTLAFLFVGAQGPNTTSDFGSFSKNSFNGGGYGHQSRDTHNMASSGGGSSDIRLLSSDIYHRLIIAGGGGGSGFYNGYHKGGNGGGESGETGDVYCPSSTSYAGSGASQNSGNLLYGYNISSHDGCGGGGGLYGGKNGYGYNNSGGGGSGFVFNETTTSIAKAASIVLTSKYQLFDAHTSVSDHLGDGLITITVLSFIKKCVSRRIVPWRIKNFVLLVILVSC